MPSSDDAAISALLFALRQNTEGSEAAWLQLREILRVEPERVAARLCSWLDECLASGVTIPVQASIILTVTFFTKNQPNLIPEHVLRRLLSRAEHLDDLSLLCLAAALAKLRPDAILTPGVSEVLVATEHALIEPENESDREVQQYVKKVALELWRTVAARDPASLVALLEAWAATAGWQLHSSHLFAELLLEAVPLHPNILGETIAVLEAIQAEEKQSPGKLEPPDRFLNRLHQFNETLQHKAIVERITREILSAYPPPGPVLSSSRPSGDKPSVAPDSKVDRLIEEYLALPEYMERRAEAERRIAKAMQSGSRYEVPEEDILLAGSDPPAARLLPALGEPYTALVEGVTELVDELVAADPPDERSGILVVQLCFGLHRHTDQIPVEKFQQWVSGDAIFGDEVKIWLYDCLAAVCPDWIVEHRLIDAVAIAITRKSTDVLSALGVYYPGFLRGFVERYLTEVVGDMEITHILMRVVEDVARQRPEEGEAMIAVLERLRGDSPGQGLIDFRYIALSNALNQLRSMGGTGKP